MRDELEARPAIVHAGQQHARDPPAVGAADRVCEVAQPRITVRIAPHLRPVAEQLREAAADPAVGAAADPSFHGQDRLGPRAPPC
eukprot:2228529-Lingulodinium_polyedra.AAC.1